MVPFLLRRAEKRKKRNKGIHRCLHPPRISSHSLGDKPSCPGLGLLRTSACVRLHLEDWVVCSLRGDCRAVPSGRGVRGGCCERRGRVPTRSITALSTVMSDLQVSAQADLHFCDIQPARAPDAMSEHGYRQPCTRSCVVMCVSAGRL